MQINYLAPDIIEVKGFLSPEQCRDIVDMVRRYPEDAWWGETNQRTFSYENDQWLGKNLHPQGEDRQHILDIGKKIESVFSNYSKIQNIAIVHRIIAGSGGVHLHTDNGQPDDRNNTFGVVLYLNDNFSGGEIEYPRYGIAYHPVEGSLIIHNASLEHKVNEVTSGERYMLTTFVTGYDDSPAEIGEFNDL